MAGSCHPRETGLGDNEGSGKLDLRRVAVEVEYLLSTFQLRQVTPTFPMDRCIRNPHRPGSEVAHKSRVSTMTSVL